MHFLEFGGMIPKVHPKHLGNKYSELAVDLDVYGGRFKPLRELGESLPVVDINGNVFVGRIESLHYQDGIYIAFDYYTTVAPDYSKRLGETSFFFVGKDKRLYRQSANRVALKKPPILVGVEAPHCSVKPTAETLNDQGCEANDIDLLCVPMYDKSCGDKIPFNTAFCFTYVNACGEESKPSMPTNHVEFYDGDAIKTVSNDQPPSNAVKRRWYMLVSDSEGIGRWLYVGENKTSTQEFYNNNCIMSMGEELDTEMDGPPPSCVTGVSAVGNNQIALWQGKSVYFSHPKRWHAFDLSQEYRLQYNILRIEEVTSPIEQDTHHTMLVLTDGLHYIINAKQELVHISEIETHAPAINAQAVCVADKILFFVSPRGVYEFTSQGIKLITGPFFTENEWRMYYDQDTRIAFYNDRLHGVGKKCWVMNFSEDDRRDPSFVLTTEDAYLVYATVLGGLVFAMRKGEGRPAELRKWGELLDGQNRCAVWRSPPMVMAGLWRPVTVKVVSPHFKRLSAGAEQALQKYKDFLKRNCNVTAEQFVELFPELREYYSEISGKYPTVDVIIYADGVEYYRRRVRTNKPFLLPRKYRAIDWSVEVRSRIEIDEIHIQTSRETLLEQG